MSDETKVSVEEMLEAIDQVLSSARYVPFGMGRPLMAARDYILAAEKEIDGLCGLILEMLKVTGPNCPQALELAGLLSKAAIQLGAKS